MDFKKAVFYFSNTDKVQHKPLYVALLELAKANKIEGATVLKGISGFGKSSNYQSSTLFELTDKSPIIVYVIDEKEKLLNFIEKAKELLEKAQKGVLITIEDVDIIHYHIGKNY